MLDARCYGEDEDGDFDTLALMLHELRTNGRMRRAVGIALCLAQGRAYVVRVHWN